MKIKPFLKSDWNGEIIDEKEIFITAIGSGTTYPDYKQAPFIFNRNIDGVDLVTIVTEAIFSYCGVKIKIDTDRHLGLERSIIRYKKNPNVLDLDGINIKLKKIKIILDSLFCSLGQNKISFKYINN